MTTDDQFHIESQLGYATSQHIWEQLELFNLVDEADVVGETVTVAVLPQLGVTI